MKLTYSEGQIGWIPYILTRADRVWEHNRGWSDVAVIWCPSRRAPTTGAAIYGCFFDDAAGLAAIERIGADQVTFETDYPHADGTWPHSKAVAERLFADLDDDIVHKIVRGNTIRLFGIESVNPT